MAPPKTTIVIQRNNIPENWLVGIDFSFFNANNVLKGIKNVPDGPHIFHYSTDNLNRRGLWIDGKDGQVVILRWNEENEIFDRIDTDALEDLNRTKTLSNLGNDYNYMISYTDQSEWNNQTNKVDKELLDIILKSDMTTMMASSQENQQLKEKIQFDEKEINYTAIEFKVKRGQTESEVTSNYLDKTWYINEVFECIDDLLGELQVSFIHFIIFGNYSSVIQWINLLQLISMSENLLTKNKQFAHEFLSIFALQLNHLPCEYLDLSDTPMVDLVKYKQIMKNLNSIVKDLGCNPENTCGKMKLNGMLKNQWDKILELQRGKFNIDLERDVEDDIEDEQPVIVEI